MKAWDQIRKNDLCDQFCVLDLTFYQIFYFIFFK